MNRKLGILVTLVAAAAIAFWWWKRDPKPQTTEAATTAEGSAAQLAVRGAKPGDTRPSTFARMIDDDPKGSLQLEGQVIDAEDHPVKGATVLLSANPPRTTTTED